MWFRPHFSWCRSGSRSADWSAPQPHEPPPPLNPHTMALQRPPNERYPHPCEPYTPTPRLQPYTPYTTDAPPPTLLNWRQLRSEGSDRRAVGENFCGRFRTGRGLETSLTVSGNWTPPFNCNSAKGIDPKSFSISTSRPLLCHSTIGHLSLSVVIFRLVSRTWPRSALFISEVRVQQQMKKATTMWVWRFVLFQLCATFSDGVWCNHASGKWCRPSPPRIHLTFQPGIKVMQTREAAETTSSIWQVSTLPSFLVRQFIAKPKIVRVNQRSLFFSNARCWGGVFILLTLRRAPGAPPPPQDNDNWYVCVCATGYRLYTHASTIIAAGHLFLDQSHCSSFTTME